MMAEMELDEDLRRIDCSKRKDPKLFLDKISALNIRYGIAITTTGKCAVILGVGQKDSNTVITATKNRETKTQEMLDVMHKQ